MKVRLAMREEGKFWNAYLALEDTMDDAKLIGSIMMGAVRKNPQAKETFMALMREILFDAVEDVTGERPEKWDVKPAPESERPDHEYTPSLNSQDMGDCVICGHSQHAHRERK